MIRSLLVAGVLSGAVLLGIAASSNDDLAFAQPAAPAPTAQRIMQDVQKTYATAAGVKVGFEQSVTNATFGRTTTHTGTLFLTKPDRFRFDYVGKKSPLQKAIIYDGTDLWIIEPDKLQIIQTTITPGNLPTAIAFWNGASLGAHYHIAFPTTASKGAPSGGGGTVIELTPKQPNADVKVAYFVVDPRTATVSQMVLINSNDDVSKFSFGKPDLAATNAPSIFVVNPASMPAFKLIKNPGTTPAPAPNPSTPAPAPSKGGATPPPTTKPVSNPLKSPTLGDHPERKVPRDLRCVDNPLAKGCP